MAHQLSPSAAAGYYHPPGSSSSGAMGQNHLGARTSLSPVTSMKGAVVNGDSNGHALSVRVLPVLTVKILLTCLCSSSIAYLSPLPVPPCPPFLDPSIVDGLLARPPVPLAPRPSFPTARHSHPHHTSPLPWRTPSPPHRLSSAPLPSFNSNNTIRQTDLAPA